MAGVPNDALRPLGPWPQGVNNRASETSLPTDEFGSVLALRQGVNVDLSDDGKVTRRQGRSLVHALVGLNSLYATRLSWLLGVTASALHRFDASLTRTIAAVLTTDAPMSYDEAAGTVFYSNGTDSGQLQADGSVRAWAVSSPGGPPDAAAYAGAGGLRPGTYAVAVTFFDADGRESAASSEVVVDVLEGQGIALSNLPAAGSDVVTVRVYCTSANGGEEFYVAQDVPVGVSTVLIGAHTPGRLLDTRHLSPMPPGQIVRTHAARLHVARGNVHFWSEALNYGLGKLHENHVAYAAPITLLETIGQASDAGMFLAAGDVTYYLSGPDPKTWERTEVYAAGAVPYSSAQVSAKSLGLKVDGTVPVWLASDGQLLVGLPSGKVELLHGDNYVAPSNVERAAIALREFGGRSHLVVTMKGGTKSGLAATDTVESEVWKGGVRIS